MGEEKAKCEEEEGPCPQPLLAGVGLGVQGDRNIPAD